MTKPFDDAVLTTYAELCMQWRLEIASCCSNGEDLNAQLLSLEEVIEAFGIKVPGRALSVSTASYVYKPKAQDSKVLAPQKNPSGTGSGIAEV